MSSLIDTCVQEKWRRCWLMSGGFRQWRFPAPLKVSVCFCGTFSVFCVCVWGGCLNLSIYLWLLKLIPKRKVYRLEIQIVFNRDFFYLHCHQWLIQGLIPPHTLIQLWAICYAVPKNVSLLIFRLGCFLLLCRCLNNIKSPTLSCNIFEN